MKRLLAIFAVAVLCFAQVTSPPGTIITYPGAPPGGLGINGAQGALQVTVNGITGSIPLVAQVSVPVADMLCASGNDISIGKNAVTAVTTGATTALTGTNFNGWNMAPGVPVILSGFGDAGFNGTYTTLAGAYSTFNYLPISLNSTSLTFTGAGTPNVSMACSNTSDLPTGGQQFATTYTAPANAFLAPGKQLRIDAEFAIWTPAVTGAVNLYWHDSVSNPWGAVGGVMTGNLTLGATFPGSLEVTATVPPNVTAPLLTGGGSGFAAPGWTPLYNYQGALLTQIRNTTIPAVYGATFRPVLNGAGGTITAAQGTGVTTGAIGNFCIATATGTQLTGQGAVWFFLLTSASSIAGTQTFSKLPGTSTGGGYTAVPTATWTLSLPTAAQGAAAGLTPATACSGIATASGGTLVGATGFAMAVLSQRATWFN